MTTRHAPRLLLLYALALGCERKAPAPPVPDPAAVATVVRSEGLAEAERAGAWHPALPGAALLAGDAVRTAAAATARLRFRSGRHLDLAERSLVRLGLDAHDSLVVTVELGEAFIEGDGELSVGTPHGPTHLDAETRMRIRVEDGRTRYEVLVGRAVLGDGAQAIVVGQGEGFSIALGRAEVERYRLTVGAAEIEGQPGGRDTPPTPPSFKPPPESPGTPGPVDLLVTPGESPVIHAAHDPVLVRFTAPPRCSEKTALRLGSGRRAQASATLQVSLRPGRYPYHLRCGNQRVASGTLKVVRDAGLRRVPRTAPNNEIDSDGRRYTVLFQNQLPALGIAWQDAPPSAGPYTLHVATGSDVQRFEKPVARFSLPSGQLSEGNHLFWIAPAKGRPSPRTHLQIRFDNATVAGQVRTPPDGVEVAPQDDIEVAGVAIQGSEVAVAGTRLSTDAQGRFRGRVPVPAPDRRAIAIRLEHPHGGLHYYVRRILRVE